MLAPQFDPKQRDPALVAPTDSYQPSDPIWVHRHGTWRPGIIEAASAKAAMVTYRPNSGRGTAVDTVTATHLAARTDPDPLLDHPAQPGTPAEHPAKPPPHEACPAETATSTPHRPSLHQPWTSVAGR